MNRNECKGRKVTCTDETYGNLLTYGKEYVILGESESHDAYLILDDSGEENYFFKERFEVIQKENIKIKDKTYIIFEDGRVGYIDSICTCDKCKSRGNTEVFINDLNDKYLDCIKPSEFRDIIYFGNSLTEGLNCFVEYYENVINKQEREKNYLQGIIDLYDKKLISR